VNSLLRVAALSALLQGCQLFGFGGAHIDELATGTSKPSNVAAFVSVTHKDKPVGGLPGSAFQLEENGQPINPETSQLQLIDPARYAAFHTVLLVDLGQSGQPAARTLLAKATAAFVRRARLGQAVTVVAYDGSDKVRIIADYPLDPHANAPEIVDALVSLTPTDPSRNLRGAVAQGIEILNRRLEASNRAVRAGTLAVFVRGPDLAGRFAEKELDKFLSDDTNKLVLIDVTGDKHDDTGERVSEAGVVHAQSAETLPIAFEEAATLVDGLREQYYLLSYCSPSRAGQRKLTVTVSVPDSEGKDDHDSFSTSFDATGFSAACDPQKVPPLVPKVPLKPAKSVGAPLALAPVAPPIPATAEPQPPPQSVPPVAKVPAQNPGSKKRAPTAPQRPATHSDDEEAPVPSKPGYAQ
jgi:hypothetical protein